MLMRKEHTKGEDIKRGNPLRSRSTWILSSFMRI